MGGCNRHNSCSGTRLWSWWFDSRAQNWWVRCTYDCLQGTVNKVCSGALEEWEEKVEMGKTRKWFNVSHDAVDFFDQDGLITDTDRFLQSDWYFDPDDQAWWQYSHEELEFNQEDECKETSVWTKTPVWMVCSDVSALVSHVPHVAEKQPPLVPYQPDEEEESGDEDDEDEEDENDCDSDAETFDEKKNTASVPKEVTFNRPQTAPPTPVSPQESNPQGPKPSPPMQRSSFLEPASGKVVLQWGNDRWHATRQLIAQPIFSVMERATLTEEWWYLSDFPSVAFKARYGLTGVSLGHDHSPIAIGPVSKGFILDSMSKGWFTPNTRVAQSLSSTPPLLEWFMPIVRHYAFYA